MAQYANPRPGIYKLVPQHTTGSSANSWGGQQVVGQYIKLNHDAESDNCYFEIVPAGIIDGVTPNGREYHILDSNAGTLVCCDPTGADLQIMTACRKTKDPSCRWKFQKVSPGIFYIQSCAMPDYYLAVSSRYTHDGAEIILWTKEDNPHFHWRIKAPDGTDEGDYEEEQITARTRTTRTVRDGESTTEQDQDSTTGTSTTRQAGIAAAGTSIAEPANDPAATASTTQQGQYQCPTCGSYTSTPPKETPTSTVPTTQDAPPQATAIEESASSVPTSQPALSSAAIEQPSAVSTTPGQPTTTEPTASQPTTTESAASQPAPIEPVATQPAAGGIATSQPSTTAPTTTTPATQPAASSGTTTKAPTSGPAPTQQPARSGSPGRSGGGGGPGIIGFVKGQVAKATDGRIGGGSSGGDDRGRDLHDGHDHDHGYGHDHDHDHDHDHGRFDPPGRGGFVQNVQNVRGGFGQGGQGGQTSQAGQMSQAGQGGQAGRGGFDQRGGRH